MESMCAVLVTLLELLLPLWNHPHHLKVILMRGEEPPPPLDFGVIVREESLLPKGKQTCVVA